VKLHAGLLKTAKEMGIRSIAVYVDADKDALFVKQADESIRLSDGGYLDPKQIIDAAKRTGCSSNTSRLWIFIRKCHIC
jgi:acetyl/propionyl-CoA carboxylase alpha subunit